MSELKILKNAVVFDGKSEELLEGASVVVAVSYTHLTLPTKA